MADGGRETAVLEMVTAELGLKVWVFMVTAEAELAVFIWPAKGKTFGSVFRM